LTFGVFVEILHNKLCWPP